MESTETKTYRLILAEDHTILREGLRVILAADPEYEIIGEAEDGRQAVRLVDELVPDLLLMDLSMPRMNGMEAIREIRKRHTDLRIIVLTVHNTEEYVLAALQSGADGYVLKDATHQELIVAVRSVLAGKSYLSPSISEKVIEGYLDSKKQVKTQSAWDTLTQREREVLKLVAEGYKNKDISRELFISLKTVEKHRGNLMKKLDLHNAAELTAFAAKKGLI